MRDPLGEVVGVVGIARDITEVKRAQQERSLLEKQLAQARKLEALGRLAAGMAHEINTPVQYVAGNLRFMRSQIEAVLAAHTRLGAMQEQIAACPRCANILPQINNILPPDRMAYLVEEFPIAVRQSLQGIDHITHIVSAMRTFSHPGAARQTVVDLHQLIENTLTITYNQWKNTADVHRQFCPEPLSIPCFPPELGQALLNLVVNAVDAIEETAHLHPAELGHITVATAHLGHWAEIRITDSGCGISEDIRDKIFDYFFTTKEVGKGTGQGLAICHNIIVKLHGGSIDVDSRPGDGATFILRLPVRGVSTGAD